MKTSVKKVKESKIPKTKVPKESGRVSSPDRKMNAYKDAGMQKPTMSNPTGEQISQVLKKRAITG
jgi:hypothetical protein